MTYEEALQYVSSLQKRGWRLGLDRMERLVEELGSPHVGPRFLHVAGTNGKGTVTSFIQSILTEMGVNAGGYFSPYVYDFRERIQHRRRWIEKAEFARLAAAVIPVAERLEQTEVGGPTEFEFKTAVGFLFWQEKSCEAVALEVGLGGRLDATNVVQPAVSVITRIALDHKEHLGETIRAIAGEKAGIVKPKAPVVAATGDAEATAVIREAANRCGAPFFEYGVDFEAQKKPEGWTVRFLHHSYPNVLPNGASRVAAVNAATAIAALHVAGYSPANGHVREGLANGMPPGRMERLKTRPPFVLDGAHNPDAVRAVLAELSGRGAIGAIVWSAATGHAGGEVLLELCSSGAPVIAAPMSHPRGLPPKEIEELARRAGAIYAESVEAAIGRALELDPGADPILVTGSFYLLGEAKRAIRELLGLDTEGAFEPA